MRSTTMSDDRSWLERARSVTPLLRERAAAIEAGRELTLDVLDALHERELFRLEHGPCPRTWADTSCRFRCWRK